MLKDRRRQEKDAGVKAPEPNNNITDTSADELIRQYLGLGIDLNPEAVKSMDTIKILKEMPNLEINKMLEEYNNELANDGSAPNPNQRKEQASIESKTITEVNPNLPATELQKSDKMYTEYEKLMLYSDRDIDDTSREADDIPKVGPG